MHRGHPSPRDDDDKLIVVPSGMDFTDTEIRGTTDFQEQFFKSVIVR
jgi:inorganic pyrophosphatase